MGQTVTTCFRTAELEDHRPSPGALRTHPVTLSEEKIFSIITCQAEEEKPVLNNRTCKKEEYYSEDSEDESWSDEDRWSCDKDQGEDGDDEEDDSWSDEGAWSDEEDDGGKTIFEDDLWNSFNCSTIPYANEFIETHITLTNVKLANEKSERTYSSITQIARSSSVKRVQFCPEPELVTVIM